MPRRILVVAPKGQESELPEAFQRHAPELRAELTAAADDLVEKASKSGYDAVVCWADGAEQLDLVVRIRKSNPETPIVVVSPDTNAAFRTLALEKGASSLLPDARNLSTLVSLIEQAVLLKLAAQETRSLAKQNRGLSREVRELTERTSSLSRETWRRLERPFRQVPLPLLVSDDPGEAFQLVKALEKAEMAAPLPIVHSTAEAIAYFTGIPPFENRDRYPLPTLILLDLQTSGSAGLDLLSWIRQQHRFKHLPVIVLSGAMNQGDLKGTYGLEANSYLIKPGNFDELVEMVKAIKQYWSSLNIQPEP